MKVLQGTLREVQFTWPDANKMVHNSDDNRNDQKVLEEVSSAQLELNEVAYINGKHKQVQYKSTTHHWREVY